MPLKTVEIEGKTYAEVAEGRPVYVNDDGEETGYDGEDLAAQLVTANSEAAGRRHDLARTKEQLKRYEGIEDPAAAIAALETVKNLDDKRLIDAGQADEVRTAAVSATEERWQNKWKQEHEPVVAERDELQAKLHRETIGNRFAQSSYISEKVVSPREMVQAYFSDAFVFEDGKVFAKYANGETVYSKSNPGQLAEFDEALEILIKGSPFRDQILKGDGKRGSGAPGPGGVQTAGGEKVMTRADANNLALNNPNEMAKRMRDGWSVVDEAA